MMNSKKEDCEFARLYADWFSEKQKQNERIIPLDFADEKCNEEQERHRKLAEKIKHQGTPTILVNGYMLPEMYELEDLKYYRVLI